MDAAVVKRTGRRTILLLVAALTIGVVVQLIDPPGGLAAWSVTLAMACVAVGAIATLRAGNGAQLVQVGVHAVGRRPAATLAEDPKTVPRRSIPPRQDRYSVARRHPRARRRNTNVLVHCRVRRSASSRIPPHAMLGQEALNLLEFDLSTWGMVNRSAGYPPVRTSEAGG